MGNRYDCSSCGGIMVYDIKSGKLKCPNCSTEREIVSERPIIEHNYAEYKKTNRIETETESVENKESTTMVCKSCGATIEISPEITATSCPYCNSHIVLAEKQEEAIVPDGIMPFKVDMNQANLNFMNWIKGKKLAPSALKNLYQKDKFLPVYMPYWTFDADVQSYYKGQGGIYREETYRDDKGETHTRTVTDWYPTSGEVGSSFDDIEVRAATTLDEKCMKSVGAFTTASNLKGYAPEYMSGFTAERYTVPIETAHSEAVNIMENSMKKLAENDILRRYDTARVTSITSNFYNETYKHVMLPIYATSYGFKGKTYNVLINGETGNVSGQYPKSYAKIAIIVVAVIIVIAALLMIMNKADAAEVYAYCQNMMGMCQYMLIA